MIIPGDKVRIVTMDSLSHRGFKTRFLTGEAVSFEKKEQSLWLVTLVDGRSELLDLSNPVDSITKLTDEQWAELLRLFSVGRGLQEHARHSSALTASLLADAGDQLVTASGIAR